VSPVHFGKWQHRKVQTICWMQTSEQQGTVQSAIKTAAVPHLCGRLAWHAQHACAIVDAMCDGTVACGLQDLKPCRQRTATVNSGPTGHVPDAGSRSSGRNASDASSAASLPRRCISAACPVAPKA